MATAPKPLRPRKNEGLNAPPGGGMRVTLDSIKFELICERYAETGAAIASCEALGFSYDTVRGAMAKERERGNETWHELWDFSYQKFRESLEQEVFRRGRDGAPTRWAVDKVTGLPVLDATGKPVVTEVTFSDRLLELAVKGHFPERYRENIHVSGTMGLEPIDAFANLTPKAKRAIRAIVMQDLEEQRQAREAVTVDAQALDVSGALDDMRQDDAG